MKPKNCATTVAVEKIKRITYSECVSLALDIQYGKRKRHILVCSVSCSTIFFPHYLI